MALNLTGDAAGEAKPDAAQHAKAEAKARALADAIDRGELVDDGARPFTIRLQPRHADYLEARAAAWGETPEKHMERVLREFRATDPWRQSDTRPTEQGGMAGSGRR